MDDILNQLHPDDREALRSQLQNLWQSGQLNPTQAKNVQAAIERFGGFNNQQMASNALAQQGLTPAAPAAPKAVKPVGLRPQDPTHSALSQMAFEQTGIGGSYEADAVQEDLQKYWQSPEGQANIAPLVEAYKDAATSPRGIYDAAGYVIPPIALSGAGGYPNIASGAYKLAVAPDRKSRFEAANELGGGAMEAATPLLGSGLASNPVATSKYLLTGMAAQHGAEMGLTEAGAPPEEAQFGGMLAGLVPLGHAAKEGLPKAKEGLPKTEEAMRKAAVPKPVAEVAAPPTPKPIASSGSTPQVNKGSRFQGSIQDRIRELKASGLSHEQAMAQEQAEANTSGQALLETSQPGDMYISTGGGEGGRTILHGADGTFHLLDRDGIRQESFKPSPEDAANWQRLTESESAVEREKLPEITQKTLISPLQSRQAPQGGSGSDVKVGSRIPPKSESAPGEPATDWELYHLQQMLDEAHESGDTALADSLAGVIDEQKARRSKLAGTKGKVPSTPSEAAFKERVAEPSEATSDVSTEPLTSRGWKPNPDGTYSRPDFPGMKIHVKGDQWIGEQSGRAIVRGFSNFTLEKHLDRITPEESPAGKRLESFPTIEQTVSEGGSGALSSEEINRSGSFYHVDKSGNITYLGKQVDVSDRVAAKGGAVIRVAPTGAMETFSGDSRLLVEHNQKLRSIARGRTYDAAERAELGAKEITPVKETSPEGIQFRDAYEKKLGEYKQTLNEIEAHLSAIEKGHERGLLTAKEMEYRTKQKARLEKGMREDLFRYQQSLGEKDARAYLDANLQQLGSVLERKKKIDNLLHTDRVAKEIRASQYKIDEKGNRIPLTTSAERGAVHRLLGDVPDMSKTQLRRLKVATTPAMRERVKQAHEFIKQQLPNLEATGADPGAIQRFRDILKNNEPVVLSHPFIKGDIRSSMLPEITLRNLKLIGFKDLSAKNPKLAPDQRQALRDIRKIDPKAAREASEELSRKRVQDVSEKLAQKAGALERTLKSLEGATGAISKANAEVLDSLFNGDKKLADLTDGELRRLAADQNTIRERAGGNKVFATKIQERVQDEINRRTAEAAAKQVSAFEAAKKRILPEGKEETRPERQLTEAKYFSKEWYDSPELAKMVKGIDQKIAGMSAADIRKRLPALQKRIAKWNNENLTNPELNQDIALMNAYSRRMEELGKPIVPGESQLEKLAKKVKGETVPSDEKTPSGPQEGDTVTWNMATGKMKGLIKSVSPEGVATIESMGRKFKLPLEKLTKWEPKAIEEQRKPKPENITEVKPDVSKAISPGAKALAETFQKAQQEVEGEQKPAVDKALDGILKATKDVEAKNAAEIARLNNVAKNIESDKPAVEGAAKELIGTVDKYINRPSISKAIVRAIDSGSSEDIKGAIAYLETSFGDKPEVMAAVKRYQDASEQLRSKIAPKQEAKSPLAQKLQDIVNVDKETGDVVKDKIVEWVTDRTDLDSNGKHQLAMELADMYLQNPGGKTLSEMYKRVRQGAPPLSTWRAEGDQELVEPKTQMAAKEEVQSGQKEKVGEELKQAGVQPHDVDSVVAKANTQKEVILNLYQDQVAKQISGRLYQSIAGIPEVDDPVVLSNIQKLMNAAKKYGISDRELIAINDKLFHAAKPKSPAVAPKAAPEALDPEAEKAAIRAAEIGMKLPEEGRKVLQTNLAQRMDMSMSRKAFVMEKAFQLYQDGLKAGDPMALKRAKDFIQEADRGKLRSDFFGLGAVAENFAQDPTREPAVTKRLQNIRNAQMEEPSETKALASLPVRAIQALYDKWNLLNNRPSMLTKMFYPEEIRGFSERTGIKELPINLDPWKQAKLAYGGGAGVAEASRIVVAKVMREAGDSGLMGSLMDYLNLRAYDRALRNIQGRASRLFMESDRVRQQASDLWDDIRAGVRPYSDIEKVGALKKKSRELRVEGRGYISKLQDSKVVPEGYNRQAVGKDLDLMKQSLGPDDFKRVENWADTVYSEGEKFWTAAKDSGMISEEVYQHGLDLGRGYIPLQRIFEVADKLDIKYSGKSLQVRTRRLLQKLEGSELYNQNPFEALINQISLSNREIQKNNVSKAILNLQNIDPQGWGQMFKPYAGERLKEGEGVLTVWDGGIKTQYKVPDWLSSTVDNASLNSTAIVGGVTMRFVANVFRKGATIANVGFAIPNAVRDVGDFAMLSKAGITGPIDAVKMIGQWATAFKEVAKEDPNYLDYLRARAGFSTLTRMIEPSREYHRPFVDPLQTMVKAPIQALGEGKPIKALGEATLGAASRVIRTVEDLNDTIEQATKLMAFKRMKAKEPFGPLSKEQLDKIALETRNFGGSPDFGSAGTMSPAINLAWMFFNANIQGTGRTIGRMVRDPKTLLSILGVSTMMAMAQYTHNSQFVRDDGSLEVDHISDTDKHNYFYVILGTQYDTSTGQTRARYLKVPKPHWARVVYNPIEDAVQSYIRGNVDLGQTALDLVSNVLPGQFNLQKGKIANTAARGVVSSLNPAVREPLEQAMDLDSYRGIPIEGKGMEGLENPMKADQNTSISAQKIAKVIYDNTGQESGFSQDPTIGRTLTSPKRLQHAWEGFTAGVGGFVENAADSLQGQDKYAAKVPLTGDEKVAKMGLLGPIARRFVGSQLDQVEKDMETDFYDTLQASTTFNTTFNHFKKTDPDQAEKYLEDPRRETLVEAHKTMDKMSKELGAIRQESKRVLDDVDMTPEERLEAIKDLYKQKMEILKFFKEDLKPELETKSKK